LELFFLKKRLLKSAFWRNSHKSLYPQKRTKIPLAATFLLSLALVFFSPAGAFSANPYKKVSAEYGVLAWLLFSIAYVESGLNLYGVNCNGRPYLGLSYQQALYLIPLPQDRYGAHANNFPPVREKLSLCCKSLFRV